MSDNGFNPLSSLWLQGSFQTDACTYWVTFSSINFTFYTGAGRSIYWERWGKNGNYTPFLCKTQ